MSALVRWEELLPWYPGYWISDDGRAIGRRGHELKLRVISGYRKILVPGVNGGYHWVSINRAVCWNFNGPFPNNGIRYDAAHLDCDPSNNHWWNLEWQTRKENQNHPITRARSSVSAKRVWADPAYRAKVAEIPRIKEARERQRLESLEKKRLEELFLSALVEEVPSCLLERNARIRELLDSGLSIPQVAEAYELTRQRVHQISRYAPGTGSGSCACPRCDEKRMALPVFVPERLTAARLRAGMSIVEVAWATGTYPKTIYDSGTGICYNTIDAWEKGINVPRPLNIQRVADVLGIQVSTLYQEAV